MGKYVLKLVSGLATADGCDEYVVYGDAKLFPQLASRANIRFRNPGRLPYPLWEQLVLPLWVRQDDLDLLHCPANTAPIILPRRIRLVVTIHDVMFLLPASVLSASKVLRQRLGNFYRRMVATRVARRADRIITDSEYSRQEIVKYLKVFPDGIRVVYLGIDESFSSLADANASPPKEISGQSLDGPFILALGAGDPRKNTMAVIRAYGSRRLDLPNLEKLVIVGLRDWRGSAAYELVDKLGLSKSVLLAGYVSEELLTRLYTSASCLLYPTLYEGFGFPVLEAMACGTPVITSDCTSVPEVAGGAAILVDPSSEESIGNALVRVLRDEPLRRQLIERGKVQVRKFSWQETVRKTLDVYAELNEKACGLAMAAGKS